MPVQQAIQRAFVDLVANPGFQCQLDLHGRGHFSSGSTRQERVEQGLFLLPCEVLVTTSAFPRRVNGSYSGLIVGRNHAVDGRGRYTNCPGNVLGLARRPQSLLDDLPTLAAPGMLFLLHPLLNRLPRQMRGGTCNAVSHHAALLSFKDSFLEYHVECVWVGTFAHSL